MCGWLRAMRMMDFVSFGVEDNRVLRSLWCSVSPFATSIAPVWMHLYCYINCEVIFSVLKNLQKSPYHVFSTRGKASNNLSLHTPPPPCLCIWDGSNKVLVTYRGVTIRTLSPDETIENVSGEASRVTFGWSRPANGSTSIFETAYQILKNLHDIIFLIRLYHKISPINEHIQLRCEAMP